MAEIFYADFFWGGQAGGEKGAALHDLQDLVSQPWTEPRLLAVRAQNPNHWTTREFPVAEIF